MAIEKHYTAVPPVAFTAAGTARGKVTVTSTAGFHVKMEVTINHPSQPEITLQVKRVISSTQMILGPTGQPIDKFTNLISYDAQTFIYAKEQLRPNIPLQEIERAVYQEEPAVALRTLSVDEFGSPYRKDNPLHVYVENSTDGSSSGDVRVVNGSDVLKINPDGSINVQGLDLSSLATEATLNTINNNLQILVNTFQSTDPLLTDGDGNLLTNHNAINLTEYP